MTLSYPSKSVLNKKINEYLDSLKERDASTLTIRNYKHYLNRLSSWLGERITNPKLTDISQKIIDDYKEHLSTYNLSKKTLGYHLIAVRSFLKWLRSKGNESMAPENIVIPHAEPKNIKFLTGEQINKLLNAPTLSTIQGKRDKAILEVLFSTGLRISEFTKLNRDDVNEEKQNLEVVGKKDRRRIVFLSTRALDWLKIYLRAREDHFKPLFIRHKGKIDSTMLDEKMRLTPRSIQRSVKKYVRKVKLPVEATPHTIRHSFSVDLLLAGADLRSVQEMLGHKNVSTTQIYTHITDKQLKDVHESFHGRGK